MIVLGLAGQAGVGKDTVANYLRDSYGFIVFAFSDTLYSEVRAAFGLENQDALRDRAGKEVPNDRLTLQQCSDDEFVKVARPLVEATYPQGDVDAVSISPRHILQWYGTDYRRAQDADYWVKQSHEFIRAMQGMAPYPEMRPQYFVECGTRFENERDWIHACGGNVWHIYRDGIESGGQGHVSAVPLPVRDIERELWNNDSLERLHAGIDLLLRTGAKFVKVEPMAPMEEPVEATITVDTATGYGDLVIDPAESNCAVAERIQ